MELSRRSLTNFGWGGLILLSTAILGVWLGSSIARRGALHHRGIRP